MFAEDIDLSDSVGGDSQLSAEGLVVRGVSGDDWAVEDSGVVSSDVSVLEGNGSVLEGVSLTNALDVIVSLDGGSVIGLDVMDQFGGIVLGNDSSGIIALGNDIVNVFGSIGLGDDIVDVFGSISLGDDSSGIIALRNDSSDGLSVVAQVWHCLLKDSRVDAIGIDRRVRLGEVLGRSHRQECEYDCGVLKVKHKTSKINSIEDKSSKVLPFC